MHVAGTASVPLSRVVNALFIAVSPTSGGQYAAPDGNSMNRSNSISAQDSFDLYGERHPLGGSATSLEDRPRAISRSGSFRDSTDEGEASHTYLLLSSQLLAFVRD